MSSSSNRISFDEFYRWWSASSLLVGVQPKHGAKLALSQAWLGLTRADRELERIQRIDGRFVPAPKGGGGTTTTTTTSGNTNSSGAGEYKSSPGGVMPTTVDTAAAATTNSAPTSGGDGASDDDGAWGRFKAYLCCTGRSKPNIPANSKPEKKRNNNRSSLVGVTGTGQVNGRINASPFPDSDPTPTSADDDNKPTGAVAVSSEVLENDVSGVLSPVPSAPPPSYYSDPNNSKSSYVVVFHRPRALPCPAAPVRFFSLLSIRH